MAQIDMLTSIKGVSVFIAAAIIADIINVNRFKDSKYFTSYQVPSTKYQLFAFGPSCGELEYFHPYPGDQQEREETFFFPVDPIVESCRKGQYATQEVV
jgi:hypothetical protein